LSVTPYTAPDGDVNGDGAVDVADTQCEILVFHAVVLAEMQGGEPCTVDADCLALVGPDTSCRSGFGQSMLCLPTCLASDVTLGPDPAVDCTQPGADTPQCKGLTHKRNADLNCDGHIGNQDFVFLVSIIMEKLGGPGTSDIDGDGKLNFCDDDTDGDGLDDGVDPDPLSGTPDCDDGNLCTADAPDGNGGCVFLPEPGPCQWPGKWFHSGQNPVLVPTPSNSGQGADNIYAPDVMKINGVYWMWYGGQGNDGHDSIFLARSKDLVTWQKHPAWSAPASLVDHGPANHVNDPSVVLVNGTFYMYYTEAFTAENDLVHLATSQDGMTWAKQGAVVELGPPGAWDSGKTGRPSALYEEGEFRLWYDGWTPGQGRHVGYATSPDGYTWTKHPANPVVMNEGAVDVEHFGEWYVMLTESGSGTNLYVAKDPLKWQSVGQILAKSGAGYDQFGQVTPFLYVEDDQPKALFFGGASDVCWCKNRVGLALMGQDIAGCSGCLAEQPSCQGACGEAGFTFGFCGQPGSDDPGACCACCHDWDCQPPEEPEFAVASGYRGTLLVRDGHDYGPSIINDDGKWRMWWCASPSQGGAWDSIWYAVSDDGLNWSCPKEVIKVSANGLDKSAVCDPSVVKVGGSYYLYFTAINTDVDWSNRVFLATASDPDGPWTKYPDNNNPLPILEDPACDGGNPNDYCVGQSTVLFHEGLFYHWYTDSGQGAGSPPSPLVTMLATSVDGVNYQVENGGLPVFDHADTDVKYHQPSGQFFMVYGNVDDNKLYWTVSGDGVEWLSHSDSRTIDVNLAFGQNHNPGLAGDALGHTGNTTFVMHGGGTGWGVWDMDRSDIVLGDPGATVPMCGQCVAGNDCGAGCGGSGFCGAPGSVDPQACCTCPGDCVPYADDCSLCLDGFPHCDAACQAQGAASGTCAVPGSSDPAACCSCEWSNCQGCLEGQPDCNAACQASGFSNGSCVAPESVDPGNCCACQPWADCAGCLGNHANCDQACQAAGYGKGSCAVPDSTDPANCCACSYDNCEGCLVGHPNCNAACQASGYMSGTCAVPESEDPDNCCSCQPWVDCLGCLGNHANCDQACQASGFNKGTCAAPGSTDPSNCCACAYDNCAGCLAGHPNCNAACQASGYNKGVCAAPESTDPNNCCSCAYDNCQGCLGGSPNCASACQAGGYKTGYCAVPESTDPGNCCSCEAWSNCEGCLAGYSDCNDACHHSGYPGGSCANPSSTNPSACCACSPATGCQGCLGGAPSCMSACQGIGMAGGWCANPGSQNPGACCACF